MALRAVIESLKRIAEYSEDIEEMGIIGRFASTYYAHAKVKKYMTDAD